MNPPPPRVAAPALWQSLAALACLGLERFWSTALASDDGLPGLLRQQARLLLPTDAPGDWHALKAAIERHWPPAEGALAALIRDYRLSLAETLLLTLLGEVERSHLIGLVVAALQSPAGTARPTLHLASALLDDWFGAGTLDPLRVPEMALVSAGVIQIEGEDPLPLRVLRMPPICWAVLQDRDCVWPQCRPVPPGDPALLPRRITTELPRIADLLAARRARGIVVRGPPNSGRKLLAAELARVLGCRALSIPADAWRQDPALVVACRYAHWLPVLEPRLGPGDVWRLGELPDGQPVVILLGNDGAVESHGLLEVTMPLPDEAHRRRLWSMHLRDEALAANCAANALLGGPSIAGLAASARLLADREARNVTAADVATARRHLDAEKLRLLAQPVEHAVNADAIVLPPLVAESLEHLIQRARLRESLWHGLGSTLRQTATAGLRALFVGESGTGKTLAASYVATRLGAPLYRVDLSAVMNKYIGESEKNLSALLELAAASDVTLLFDEADSLFGRRTEGKETGERFANMLTHFLLTRIETHPGIVLLTSNNRERIDAAFTRRLDLIVEFPLPGFEERLQLWRGHLGDRGPGERVCRLLASYCGFAGGQLRNVVLAAAAFAGEGPITGEHLLAGLLAEYRKSGREMPTRLQQITALPPG